jgi:glutamate/tyrosine decarboxylase-like PLP-dependent enzyme
MRSLGKDGYRRLARSIMETRDRIIAGIEATPGLRVLGKPAMGVLAFAHDGGGEFAIGELMHERGWNLDRQQNPSALHLMTTPAHAAIVEVFLADLRACTERVNADPSLIHEGAAAMYGAMATLPDRGSVHEFVLDFLDGVYRL